jgi:hypothetical protein
MRDLMRIGRLLGPVIAAAALLWSATGFAVHAGIDHAEARGILIADVEWDFCAPEPLGRKKSHSASLLTGCQAFWGTNSCTDQERTACGSNRHQYQ